MVSLAAGFGGSGTADAHHSISAVYDGRQQVTITAVVEEFRFVNPHPKIVVRAVEASANNIPASDSPVWTLEMDNRWELAELGFDDDTLQPGDRIVVTGSIGRQDDRALYVRSLEHAAADFKYQHHR